MFIVQLNEHITEDTKTAVSFRTPDEHASETNASNNAFQIRNSSSPIRNTPQQRKRSHASTGTGFSANSSRRSSFKTQCMAQPVNNVGRQKQSKAMGNYRASNSKTESITVEDDSFTTQPIKTETDLDVLFIDSTDGDGSSNQNTLCDFPKQDAVYPQSSDDFPKAETKMELNNLNSSLWPLDAASGNERASSSTKCQNLRKSKQSRDKTRLSESNNWWGNTDGNETYATWGTDPVGLDDGSGEISGQLLTEQVYKF